MITCPVCGQYVFAKDNDYDICDVCMWENDGLQLDEPDLDGCANELSLNEYRVQWQEKQTQEKKRSVTANTA